MSSWCREVAEESPHFDWSSLVRHLGCIPTRAWKHKGRLIKVKSLRAGGHWSRSGENRRLGGDKSELLRYYITTSQRGGGPVLMTLWWMADSGSIKIYSDGSQRAGNRTLAWAQKCWLGFFFFFLKREHHAGMETCWCSSTENVRFTGAIACCLTDRILRQMDLLCKAWQTWVMFYFLKMLMLYHMHKSDQIQQAWRWTFIK